ncbi:hypothetical protein KAR26_02650 [Candidatus Parcubacteria bacterium]|nr:hypothetical protein [Candidatus Parcubacteria bacterium]
MKSVVLWLVCGNEVFLKEVETKAERKRQSNFFVCRPAVDRLVEQNEGFLNVLIKGVEEELGTRFSTSFPFDSLGESFYIGERRNQGKILDSHNFMAKISQKQLKKIKLHFGAKKKLISVNLEDIGKIKIVGESLSNPGEYIFLFPDQYISLKKLSEQCQQ